MIKSKISVLRPFQMLVILWSHFLKIIILSRCFAFIGNNSNCLSDAGWYYDVFRIVRKFYNHVQLYIWIILNKVGRVQTIHRLFEKGIWIMLFFTVTLTTHAPIALPDWAVQIRLISILLGCFPAVSMNAFISVACWHRELRWK